jgi:nucleotide-binding universal stress UspA family protein
MFDAHLTAMKTILVALDGSTRAPDVLAAAVAMARAHGGQLVVMRAVGLPPDVPQDFFKLSDQPLADVLRRHAVAYLESCLGQIPQTLRAPDGLEVTVGVPWEAVCNAARRHSADLIVIGSHGYGGLDRLLGTTAAKIVNHAHCSVMVVRDPASVDLERKGHSA